MQLYSNRAALWFKVIHNSCMNTMCNFCNWQNVRGYYSQKIQQWPATVNVPDRQMREMTNEKAVLFWITRVKCVLGYTDPRLWQTQTEKY